MTFVFGIIFALAALIFMVVGYMALAGGIQQKKRCSASVPGTVVRVHVEEKARSRGKRPLTVYTPEFRFNADGVAYSYRSSFSSLRREFQEGQNVTICYDPADPSFCYVADDPNTSPQGGIMCLIIGVLLAIAAVVMFV